MGGRRPHRARCGLQTVLSLSLKVETAESLLGLLALALEAEAALLGVGGALAGSLAVKDHAGVAEEEGKDGNNNEDTLEDDEGDLVGDELAVVALAQLGDTEGASAEDEDGGDGQAREEDIDAPAETLEAAGHGVADEVVSKGNDKGKEDNDLEDEAGHGDVDADVVAVTGLGGHGTTDGLEDEADEVKGDEDPVEELGLEAGQLGAEEDDGLGEGDVDGSGVEDGGNGEADNLHHKPAKVKGVVVLHDTTNVADDLGQAAQDHARHEAPALPSEAEVDVDEANDAKEGSEDDIGGQRGPVLEDTGLDGAEVEGTVGVGAKADEAVGELGNRHYCGSCETTVDVDVKGCFGGC
jgi:hypothetical protein